MSELLSSKAIALLSVFIALLLSLFLITVKTDNKKANRLLATYVLLCGIDIMGVFLSGKLQLFLFTKSFTFLLFPVLYFFIQSICYPKRSFRPMIYWHSVFFVAYNLVLLYIILMRSSILFTESFCWYEWLIDSIILKTQALVYLIAGLQMLKTYQRNYLNEYANTQPAIFSWLRQLIVILLLMFPFTLARDIFTFTRFSELLSIINYALLMAALFLFSWIILQALYKPGLFGMRELTGQTTREKSKKSFFENGETKLINTELVNSLKQYMTEHQPFLDSGLSLQELSQMMNVSPRDLSLVINQCFGKNFFDFVNDYRIAKACELLKNRGKNRLTVQQVMYDVGFNSKSSFNNAFKKQTGHTPTEYRNQMP